MFYRFLLTTFCIAGAMLSSSAMAEDHPSGRTVEGSAWDAQERFMIRARLIDVIPNDDSSTTIGGTIDPEFGIAPEVDFTYFFTDHFAAELIAATTKHDVKAKNTALGSLDLGSVWALPPTLTAQYHINPHGQIRPYVGAGLGYIFWYNEDEGPVVNDIKYESGISYALQAGIDVGITEHWSWNVDIKKLFHNVDAKVNGGAVRADVDIDPWVIGTGIVYRF
jgi:outer membrane protein